jgi:HK97 gp10 family phage protein
MPRVTLKSRLPTIAAELRPRVSAAVKKGAEAVAEDARQRVALGPPPTHIKDHIEVGRHEAAGYYVAATARDERGIPYAHMHEFGTVNHAPYPFLIPALEAQAEGIETLVAASLRAL